MQQPKTNIKIDKKSFESIKRTIKNISIASKGRENNPCFATELPQALGIKLTNRCNLRCSHCYQWNKDGYHHNMNHEEQNQDIDFEIVRKIFKETKKVKSRLYIWGGEPLIYKEFTKIIDLLKEDPRETTICTNGILIEKYLNDLAGISENLEFFIGVEGFEEEHDTIRGKGVFKKVFDGINLMTEYRKKDLFKGKISLHLMINDNMVTKLFRFIRFCEEIGVDMIFLCFPWYISDETSSKMDDYFKEKFNWLNNYSEKIRKSWHSFKYRLNPDRISDLKKEMRLINEKIWNIRIRYQPLLEFDEIENFILGKEKPGQKRSKCLAVSNRMDVNADGSVSTCHYFSEFTFGNLKNESIANVWSCKDLKKIREIISDGLMPVCSKCNVLYLNGL